MSIHSALTSLGYASKQLVTGRVELRQRLASTRPRPRPRSTDGPPASSVIARPNSRLSLKLCQLPVLGPSVGMKVRATAWLRLWFVARGGTGLQEDPTEVLLGLRYAVKGAEISLLWVSESIHALHLGSANLPLCSHLR